MGKRRSSFRWVSRLMALSFLFGAGFAATSAFTHGAVLRLGEATSTTIVTSTSVTEPTTTTVPTSTQAEAPCSVKINAVQRFDFATGKFVPYAGATLLVQPFDVIKLRFDLTLDIPAKHTVRFFTSKGQLQKLAFFDPVSVDGPKVASGQFLFMNLKVPIAQQDGSPTVGNAFSIQMDWRCESKTAEVAGGMLGTLAFRVVAGPNPGSISGTLSEAKGKPAEDCLVDLLLNGGLVGKTFTDENGSYSFTQLLPGTYSVEATGLCGRREKQKGVFTTQSKPAVVKSDETTSIDFLVTREKGKR